MEEVRNRFFVLEGVDGSGKTTIARRIAERTNGLYIKTPGEEYGAIRPYIDNGAPTEAKLLFYLSSVFDASAKIQRTLQYRGVICDRYLWSTLIPHAAYFEKDLAQLERFVAPLVHNLTLPQNTVLITVDEEQQMERLKREGNTEKLTVSDKFCFDPILRGRVRKLYDEIADRENWMKIDTTNKNAKAIAEEIIERCGIQYGAR